MVEATDVRAGNVKQVASAVGEGSIAVSFVHQVLAEQAIEIESADATDLNSVAWSCFNE